MPENENIIPEAEVVETVEQVVSPVSFSPVSNNEEEVIVDREDEIVANEPETVIENQEVIEPEDEYEEVELNEDVAMEYLAESKGMTLEEFRESLTPREQKKYAPEMEKFNEFIEKTGNTNYEDFKETQKDWSAESNESRLRNYLKLSNPELSAKEVEHLYNKKYNIEGLDEDDDEYEILERGINSKTDLKGADAFFQKRKEEFNAEGGSDEHIPIAYREARQQVENQSKQEEAFEAENKVVRDNFVSRTESLFSSNFEGFKVQLGDEKTGFEDFTIKPENLNEIKDYQLDSTNRVNEFVDQKTGEIKDILEYHTSEYMAKNYKAELNKAYQRGIAKQLDISDRASKNIQPDNMRSVQNNGGQSVTFSAAD
jgi:hypothetical protein